MFEGTFLGAWCVWQHRLARRHVGATLGYAAALVAVALVPTLAAAGVYAAAGHFDAWWYANFDSILMRRPDPRPEQWRNLLGCVLILSPLVAMAGVTLAQRRWTPDRVFLFGWLAAAIGGLLLFGSWFEHYTLPVMVPAAVCAAGAMGEHARVRRWAWPVLAIVAIGGQVVVVAKLFRRGTPAEFRRVAAAIGPGPGCLWVYSGEPIYYAWNDRCAPTRFIFPSHLSHTRERGAIGIDEREEVRRIFATHPSTIVIRPPYPGERSDIRALVLAGLSRDYREVAAVSQGKRITRVYSRR